ncbi:MAG: lipocalin family protein [Bacteroidales bacterium]|nr:lipocalin family protein [Bacteroidales bacterium]
MKKYFLAFFIFLSMGCFSSTKDIETIKGFDIEKFLGKWYEIARLDHSFERGLDYVTATYSVRDDGKIKVLNQGRDADGKTKNAEGKAFLKETPDRSGELRVSFFWIFYAKYRIIMLDENYTYAVVTSSNRDYLWILSRTPVISDTLMEELLNFCKNLQFKTDKLIFPKQV